MAIYIMLSRLTAEGAKTIQDHAERIQEVDREVEQLGAKVQAQYALLGTYDFLTVLEAPSPETMARVSVELGRRGTAKYETFPAIPIEQFIASLKR
jgi:uncharacterized protein with GYD domain